MIRMIRETFDEKRVEALEYTGVISLGLLDVSETSFEAIKFLSG